LLIKIMIARWIQPVLLFLNLAAITACAIILHLIWWHETTPAPAPAPVKWDYSEFEFDDSRHNPYPGHNIIIFFNQDQTNLDWKTNTKFTDAVTLNSLEETLSKLGEDGWELAWTDGNRCLVKRTERDDRRHDGFSIQYVPEQTKP